VVRKYLGTCLLSQAGVALGLGIIIETQFSLIGGEAALYGTIMLSVVTISTIILEIFGPIAAKWSLAKAGEIGNGNGRKDLVGQKVETNLVEEKIIPTEQV